MLARLNKAYFRLEQAVVVAALSLMAVTVCMDVVHRRLSADESAIGSLLLWPRKVSLRKEIERARPSATTGEVEAELRTRLAERTARVTRRWVPPLNALMLFALLLFGVRGALGGGDRPCYAPSWLSLLGSLGAAATGAALSQLGSRGAMLVLIGIVVVGVTVYVARRVLVALAAALASLTVLFARLVVSAESRWTYVALLAAVTVVVSAKQRSWQRLAVLAGGGVTCVLAWLIVPQGHAWAKELAMVLLMWVGFIGASIATYSHGHITVDFARKLVPGRARRAYEGVAGLVAAAVCGLIAYLAYLYVFGAPAPKSIYSAGARLEITDLPSWIGVAAIPLGLATSALRFFALGINALRGKLPQPQPEHGVPQEPSQ